MGWNNWDGTFHGIDLPIADDVRGKANTSLRKKYRDIFLGHLDRGYAAALGIWPIIYPIQPACRENCHINQPDERICCFSLCEKLDQF